jgi:hypothetical protein
MVRFYAGINNENAEKKAHGNFLHGRDSQSEETRIGTKSRRSNESMKGTRNHPRELQ